MAKFYPPKRYTVLVVADSRAVDIAHWIDWGDIVLDVVPAPSTGIEAAVEILIKERRDATPDLVLVLNGICDVLVKNRKTRKYFMVCDTVQEVVNHYTKQVKRGQELLEIFFDNSKWMFNPLTGADICDYNNPRRRELKGEELTEYHLNKSPSHQQPVMDAAVLAINIEIVRINKGNTAFTPYTATFVHRHYGKSYHHSYQHTSDGCHLTDEGKKYWASQILKAIDKTRKSHAQAQEQ